MDKEAVILGYDLGTEYTQISCLKMNAKEPETLSTVSGEDKYQIPTMIGLRSGSGTIQQEDQRWVFGTEAKRLAVLGEGVAIDRLLEKCLEKESVELGGQTYEPMWLLSNFLNQTIQFVKKVIGNKAVVCLMFTVPEIDEDLTAVIKSAAAHMGITKDLIHIQDYQESFYQYVVNGDRELWNHSVALFVYEENRIDYYELTTSQKNRMQYIAVDKEGYLEIEPMENRPEFSEERLAKEKDEAFANFTRRHFGKKIVSSVYLIGDGFDGEWMDESLKALCTGRRVFLGKNLYTKGACYGGYERIAPRKLVNRIYCGKHKVMSDIGLRMRVKGTESFCRLSEAGKNWFDSNSACEFILNGKKEVVLEIKSYMDGTVRKETVSLDGLPDRPKGTLRVRLELLFLSENICKAVFKDVGFGEMYPATEYTRQYEIRLD